MNVDILWSKFLDQIKEDLTSLSFKTWFADTELYKLDNGKAYVIVPMPIHKKHLIDNFSTLMVEKINSITGSNYELVLLLKEEIEKEVPKVNEYNDSVSVDDSNKTMMKPQSNLKSKYKKANKLLKATKKYAIIHR